jgi:undecaprenyl-diphosphatase
MSTLTYPEAMVVGLLQGVTELFPVSSLGHSVLIPAIIGGSWAQDLNVSKPESPYLAFIVGLHVATAAAMILYYWRDWARIIVGFCTSIRYRRVSTTHERLAWMIIFATVPVGLAGLGLEHIFRVYLSKPWLTSLFLMANGLILILGEQRRKARVLAAAPAGQAAAAGPPWQGQPQQQQLAGVEAEQGAIAADGRLSAMGYARGVLIGAAQILALCPGISRDGIVMVTSMRTGVSRQDAVRYSFLLSAPVILAAGALKLSDLFGPLGTGIHGQVFAGSALSFVGAFFAVWFLTKYVGEAKSLRPFGVYCLAAGLFAFIFVLAFR